MAVWCHKPFLRVLDSANRSPVNLGPIDLLIQLYVHLANHQDIVATQDVQPSMLYFKRWLVVRLDDALFGIAENEVGNLIRRQEGPDEGAAVGGEDAYFFWRRGCRQP